MKPTLDALTQAIRRLDGLSELVCEPSDDAEAIAARDGQEPRRFEAVGAKGDYELILETVYEGYLLHYGKARVLRPDDEDLALLAGDRLYALALELLAQRGDHFGVGVLASVIAAVAQAHAGDDELRAREVWRTAVRLIFDGPTTTAEAAANGLLVSA